MTPSYSKTSSRETASKKRKNVPTPERWAKKTLLSYLWTLVGALPILLSCALIAYFTPDPAAYVLPAGLFAAALTAFVGGGIAHRVHRQGPLTAALTNAALLSLTMLLLSFGFRAHATGYKTWVSALLHMAFFLFSIPGAWALRPRKKTSGRKKRKKRA